MKKINLFAGAAIIALGFTSCEKKSETAKSDAYEKYVDSVSNVSVDEARTNWEAIEADYNAKTAEAEAEIAALEDKTAAQERLDKAKAKYAALKAKLDAEAAAAAPAPDGTAQAQGGDRKQVLSAAYFKAGKIGEKMDFSWVNKDNILAVYNDFYNEFEKNKDSYSREDFDYIKQMYEALDAHKNTVEKQGLSSKDNAKIAELKLKFAPKFKWERMGAKAEENADAKK